MKESIGLKGNKNLWFDFTNAVKKNKEEVWLVLEPFIKDYIKKCNQ